MARRRILIVEDYQQLRELIATVLRDVGRYTVETAPDGATAETLVIEQTFDLVVLDIGLPGMLSGREIAIHARARLGCPILFITGRDFAESYCAGFMEPSDRILRKPFKMDVLLAEVGAMIKEGAPKLVKAKRTRVRAAKAVHAGTTR